jgi:hypothetical protein
MTFPDAEDAQEPLGTAARLARAIDMRFWLTQADAELLRP